MIIVADENITFAREAFGSLGDGVLVEGRSLRKENLEGAEVLIVRSVTKINEELLKGTGVKFVGTATIGDDHVDKEFLKREGVFFTNAEGCNANSVVDYFLCALIHLLNKYHLDPTNLSVGVVGVGRIGGRVAELCEQFGMRVFLNDPPLKRKSGDSKYLPLEKVLDCDVVTFHTALNRGGEDNSFHLINEKNIKYFRDGAIVINSSRGEVIDNMALKRGVQTKKIIAALDVWENEPNIDVELLKMANIATPHIAGYSTEGKANGTKIIFDKLCAFLGKENKWQPVLPVMERKVSTQELYGKKVGELNELLSRFYDIMRDDRLLRESEAKNFDEMRKKYPYRREFLIK